MNKRELKNLITEVLNENDSELSQYGIKSLDRCTLPAVKKYFPWLFKAKFEDAVISMKNDKLIWKSGLWKSGDWEGGIWEDGVWLKGNWNNGTFKGGIFKGGSFRGGIFAGGVFQAGRWAGGTWKNGKWKKNKLDHPLRRG